MCSPNDDRIPWAEAIQPQKSLELFGHGKQSCLDFWEDRQQLWVFSAHSAQHNKLLPRYLEGYRPHFVSPHNPRAFRLSRAQPGVPAHTGRPTACCPGDFSMKTRFFLGAPLFSSLHFGTGWALPDKGRGHLRGTQNKDADFLICCSSSYYAGRSVCERAETQHSLCPRR